MDRMSDTGSPTRHYNGTAPGVYREGPGTETHSRRETKGPHEQRYKQGPIWKVKTLISSRAWILVTSFRYLFAIHQKYQN